MKKVLMIAALALTLAPEAFAGKQDLKAFGLLLEGGAAFEFGMSKQVVALENVDCAFSNHTGEFTCEMSDLSAPQAMGGRPGGLTLVGAPAKALFDLLVRGGATTDAAMGVTGVYADFVSCAQVAEGVADGNASERTSCQVIAEYN